MSLPALRTPFRAPASTETAWSELTTKLASVLAVLEEDDGLLIAGKRRVGFVQFYCDGKHGTHVEAPGNYYLEPQWKLDEGQLAQLAAFGWSPPNVDEPSPEWVESDPDFRPTYFLDIELPLMCVAMAELAVATLREVYRIHHPRELEYEARWRHAPMKLPTLGLMMRPPRRP